ncbi:MAG: SUMF1/EgtB/PvdO family nonheme iron enzyme [Gemmatimonadetes bacterium]|nr:SUMF1/EgtB/PvdO family nonheme iron enzyme [Gemmatimonadota bacterium]
MSRKTHQRSLWQVLGLYAAGSWVVLQVIDVLNQNVGLPPWVFTLTLALLIIGLPITAATAYFQGFGRSSEADAAATAAGGPDAASPGRLFTWGNVLKGGVAAMALWGVAVTGWMVLGASQTQESEWDLVTGLDEMRRLVGEYDYSGANAIARELDGVITNDSVRESMWAEVSRTLTLETDPPGALALRRDYTTDSEWEELGRTPVEVERFPFGLSRVRFELEGYLPRETADFSGRLAAAPPYRLDTEETLPAGMARVGGGSAKIWAPGLEQLDSLALGDFFMDIHEVTNREYKEFVDAGGYGDPACWTHPFVRDGQVLSFEEAVAGFVDQTGRPGPSGWEVGSYPDGDDDYPVGGINWYEAEAYACFVGKALPTVYHWYTAADPFSSNHVVPLSNYDGAGPAPVGQYAGVTRDGVYDMAGNVREWTRNADGESRYNQGGGWADPEYAFNDAITSPVFDRSPANGLRLVQYPDSTNIEAASASIEKAFRDYYAETPISDEVFEVYRQMYAYDRTPLNASVISVDTLATYVRERIEMDAAYGDERLTVFVFLPLEGPGSAPHQAVVFFPGSNDLYKRSYDDMNIGILDFVLRSGRALVYPVYKGTYERGSDLVSDIQDETNLYRDHVIAWGRDIGRTIDYVETRADLDADRVSYLGISWGGVMGGILTAVEPRFKASLLVVGGLEMQAVQPMADPFHFLPRVTLPTLMLNGRYDSFFPLETSIMPFFETLGTPEADKKIVVTDANHFVLSYEANLAIAEMLDWLDRYAGPVE